MKNFKERVNAAYEKAEAATTRRSPLSMKVAALSTRVKVSAKIHKRALIISCIASAFACLLIAFILVLFVPYKTYSVNISAYKNSEYYDLIKKITKINRDNSSSTTNFEEWFGEIRYGSSRPDGSNGPGANSENYVEVTDNQVEGVIEGDLFKRSDKYIYYLHVNSDKKITLEIYSCAAENSTIINSIEIGSEKNLCFEAYNKNEIYLSADCKTITVFSPVYDLKNYVDLTEIIKIDVSDVNDLKITDKLFISGTPAGTRLYNGEFILVTSLSLSYYPDFGKEIQFVPQTGAWGNMKSLPLDKIISDGKLTLTDYTVLCTINENLLIDDCYAFLSYTDSVYVSQNNIYTVKSITTGTRNYREFTTESDISRVSYNGGNLDYAGTANVNGSILNQYSMDERDNVLRVAATTGTNINPNAAVYCIDINTFEILGSLENFAPAGESVQSARFDGNTAYVCTAETITLTDPVYAIDLSDPQNITSVDSGTISGYSISLTKFYGDTLLGIGYDDDRQLKIEIYKEDADSVKSVATYGREFPEICKIDGIAFTLYNKDTAFSSNYKNYFINAQTGYIGLAIYENYDYRYLKEDGKYLHYRPDYRTKYLLLKFDGEKLTVVNEVELSEYGSSDYLWYSRATIIDGYLYTLYYNGLQVEKVGTAN